MKTCETCVCWRKVGHSPVARHIMYDTGPVPIPPGPEGQCRLGAPVEDFKWPLTKGGDWCAAWRDQAEAAKIEARGATTVAEALAQLARDLEAEAQARPDQSAELPLLASGTAVPIERGQTAAEAVETAQQNLGAGPHGVASADTGQVASPLPTADDAGNRRLTNGAAKRRR